MPSSLAAHRYKGKHISGILQRHVATIYLTVSLGILTEVVSRERLGPTTRTAIIKDRSHHRLLKVGIVDKEEGCLRISEVYCVDATVGVILLGEEEKSAVVISEEPLWAAMTWR